MSWHNLTPQLRTRLNRLERVVGLFVFLALALLLIVLGYYFYQTAQRKGWFLTKARYFTFVDNAAGLSVGDHITLMGFEVGEVVQIEPMPPFAPWNVYVGFEVREPYYGYLWTDSRARVASGNLLANRTIELTKGTNGVPTYLETDLRDYSIDEALVLPEGHGWRFNMHVADPADSNLVATLYAPVTTQTLRRLAELGTDRVQLFDPNAVRTRLTALYDDKRGFYVPIQDPSKGYFLPPDESPALAERVDAVVSRVEHSLPNVFALTNQISAVLTHATGLADRADTLLTSAAPLLTNLNVITAQLRDPDGSLGRWLLPAELRDRSLSTLSTAEDSLRNARTNLHQVSAQLLLGLENLSLITSNLNAQVQANQFILSDLSDLVRNTDDLVQGLKAHWLLRSAFGASTNATPASRLQPTLAPP